jgi:hypothetical protein
VDIIIERVSAQSQGFHVKVSCVSIECYDVAELIFVDKMIILVGGFGESVYLKQRLCESLNKEVELVLGCPHL